MTGGRPRRAVVDEIVAALTDAGVTSPAADARWLVEHVLQDRAEASPDDVRRLRGLVDRRARREPLQLIVGRAAFRHLELACRAGVFIPRPETEVVAGLAIAAARSAGRSRRPVRVVEPCTGTGAIALALVTEVPDVEVVAIDRSAAAVELARANLAELVAGRGRARLSRGSEVTVLRGELLEPVPRAWRGSVDVLVANPPYLPSRDRATWQPEVANHDPVDALVGGPDGHEVVDALVAAAPVWLRPGGTLILEIDERRGDDARAAAEAAGLLDVVIEPDLTGADRVLVASRAATTGSMRP